MKLLPKKLNVDCSEVSPPLCSHEEGSDLNLAMTSGSELNTIRIPAGQRDLISCCLRRIASMVTYNAASCHVDLSWTRTLCQAKHMIIIRVLFI